VVHVALLQGANHRLDKRPAQPMPSSPGRHGEVENLPFVRRVERDDIAAHLPLEVGNQKERVGRNAVAEILRGPRIGEHVLFDRVDRRDVADFSGTNVEGGGRGGSPI